ncbi:formylglycine-generating enzyme family protein [Scytonema sp. PRP1]|uniref:formylglycine-generating enzyme family protein n=1 Tax=Scytonema sp. PRP1 TaxID=3120513 RepID=UPI002FD298E0
MTDDRLPNNQLKQLISRLSDNYDLTGEDIADVLWLALKQRQFLVKEEERHPSSKTDINQLNQEKPNNIPKNKNPNHISPPELSPAPPKEEPSVNIHPTKAIDEDKTASSLSEKTLPLRHPDPPSLPKQLEFAKAFRPLMRKVDSGRRIQLDELETVKRTAEEGIFIPILKSEPEPWLDLALVIDENSSMVIWRNTIQELKQLFEHYGIFREVRIWGLTKDEQGKIQIRAKIGRQERFKNPQELIDPTHRRLILIVSDCVAQIWFDGTILSTLQGWTKHQPMAIIQLLPDWMWLRTGLRIGASVELVNFIPGVANRNLRIHELLLWKDIDLEQGTKIPVFTLNPEIASLWSGFVAGIRDKVMPGFVLPSDSEFTPPPQSLQTQVSQLNPEQRVDRFRKISSPLGRKLAGLLMAAPVITLPVVRLIQKTLLPESLPVHVAEVFLGGLLKPLTEITADVNADGVLFDVMQDEIRTIFLEDAPYRDSQSIFEILSDYIEKNIGKSLKECVALLKETSTGEDGQQENLEKAYARISLKILKQFGGSYAEFAEKLETSAPVKEPISPTSEDDYPQLEELTFELATISIEPEIKTSTDIELEPFEFEVALIEINQSAQISTDSPLEMVNEEILTKTGKHLNDAEQLVLQGTLANQTYEQIAASADYSVPDLKNVGIKLWKVLSEVFGEKVTKRNLQSVLGQWAASRHLTIHRHRQQGQCFIEDLGNAVQLEMVAIPEGSFLMGSPEDELERSSSESPQHTVTISPFYMGKYPVTQAQWQAVAALPQVNRELKRDPSYFKGANRPVENVSWYDAVEFCLRLSQHTGKSYRLSSEAEWEYACRAGTTTPFHFGETMTSELANYNAEYTYGAGVKGRSRGKTTEVGSFGVANAFGLYDMHGNVWEWCLDDWHDNYEGAPKDGSAWFENDNDNLSQKQGRAVLRGGSWPDVPNFCRSAFRYYYGSWAGRDHILYNIGFRVVCAFGRILQ